MLSDSEIVSLYVSRSESAILETTRKYGSMYKKIAYNVLGSTQDAEECENDTYIRLWNTIPPNEPNDLEAYGARIIRNLAIDRCKYSHAQKRGGYKSICDELDESIPDPAIDAYTDDDTLHNTIDSFLRKQNKESRIMFVLHYFYFLTLADIATRLGASVPRIKSQLYRTRIKLKKYLEKEGVKL